MGRSAVALTLLVLLTVVARPGGSESDALARPMVTVDSLPLPIPTAVLSEPARARAEAVLGHEIFAQRVTGIRYRSREAVFEFLLDHPDFAASVARALRLGQYQLDRVGDDEYMGDDARGARGVVRLLYADPGRRLYHLEGRYDGNGLPSIAGEMLVLLEYRHEDDGAGSTVVDSSLTGHVKIDTPVVGLLAGVLTGLARPVVTRAVEQKVRRFFNTVARVSRWAYDEPDELFAALEGNPAVPQGETLTDFSRILLVDRPPAWAQELYRLSPSPLTLEPPVLDGS
jgi:hypothetical protein